jgi:hypothetical protein
VSGGTKTGSEVVCMTTVCMTLFPVTFAQRLDIPSGGGSLLVVRIRL